MPGRIVQHPLTRDTLPAARDIIRKLRDRRREVVREIDAEIDRLTKMIRDAGFEP